MKRGKIAIGGLDDDVETPSTPTPPAPTPATTSAPTEGDRGALGPTPIAQSRPSSAGAKSSVGESSVGAKRQTQSTPPPNDTTSGRRPYDSPPRRPRSERQNAFDLSAWLIEGVLGIAEEVRHNDLGLSEEFWVHAYAARRETLLAARALINTALEHCAEEEETNSQRNAARRRRGRVDINFDEK